MTPEEYAGRAVKAILDFAPIRRAAGCEPYHPDQMTAIIAAAVREAVAEERERCAKVAEEYTYPDPDGSAEQIQDEHMAAIAARIREGHE